MTSAVTVLLVETDDLELRERTEQLLMDGYAIDGVGTIAQARVKLPEGPDTLMLSSAPETIALLRQLRAGEIPRADSRLPVLVIAIDDDSAAARYYRTRADVALPSESSPLLVAAGLEALTRRAGSWETRVQRVGSLTVDRDARTAQVETRPVTLTRLEFDLLATLASEPRKTFTRVELTREVWDYDPQAAGPSRTVDSDAHPAATEARAGRRGADGADRPRRRLEAHPMTSTLPAAAAASSRPTTSPDRAALPSQCGWSRDRSRVSQDRRDWPQIESLSTESALCRGMMSAMHELPEHLLPDWSADPAGYATAYLSSYTVVYTKVKEVS